MAGMQVSAESYLSSQLEIPDSGIGEILACRIRNPRLWNTEYTSQGICNPTNDWNPESKFLKLRIRESMAWNPECQTVLDSLTCYNTSAFAKTSL